MTKTDLRESWEALRKLRDLVKLTNAIGFEFWSPGAVRWHNGKHDPDDELMRDERGRLVFVHSTRCDLVRGKLAPRKWIVGVAELEPEQSNPALRIAYSTAEPLSGWPSKAQALAVAQSVAAGRCAVPGCHVPHSGRDRFYTCGNHRAEV